MERAIITAVGIDVSKGKSMVAVRRPGGEIVLTPFPVNHNVCELKGLVETLRNIEGNIRIVMEHTGMYWCPTAHVLKEAGFFVSILQHSDPGNPVFMFMDRKRSEGKHFHVYMVAGTAKFLRIDVFCQVNSSNIESSNHIYTVKSLNIVLS